MTHHKSWMKAQMGWLPIVIAIIAVSIMFIVYLSLFNNQAVLAPMRKTAAERATDTEGISYTINRDTTVENGQCQFQIIQVIVKQNITLVYFTIENHFHSYISDVIPYLIDLDNDSKPIRISNYQQFVRSSIEPNQKSELMVGEFDHISGKSQHFKFGFQYMTKGEAKGGETFLPFDLK